MRQMRMSGPDWAQLLVLSVLWGGTFFFVDVAVKELPPFTLVMLRTGIAALVLGGVLVWRGGFSFKHPDVKMRTIWTAFCIMGLMNNLVPFSLFFWAQTIISGSLASILNAMTPIFSMIVAHIFLSDEGLSIHKLMGAGLGFCGVAVLLGGDMISGTVWSILGMLGCLMAALSYGFAAVYGRRFKAIDMPPTVAAFGQLTATTVLISPIVVLSDQPWGLALPSGPVIVSVLALAAGSTALAYVLYFRVLASAGAVNAVLVTLLIPISAILLGVIFLNDTIGVHHMAGLILIMIGLLIIDGRIGGIWTVIQKALRLRV